MSSPSGDDVAPGQAAGGAAIHPEAQATVRGSDGRFIEGHDPIGGVATRFPPGASPNEKYTQEHRAAVVALREGGGSLDAVAAASGHAKSTVQRFEKLVSPDQRQLARELLAAECEGVAKLYLKRLGLEVLADKASSRDAAVVVGIMLDKAIKLRGEDKPNPLEQPLTLRDYFLSLAARGAAQRETEP